MEFGLKSRTNSSITFLNVKGRCYLWLPLHSSPGGGSTAARLHTANAGNTLGISEEEMGKWWRNLGTARDTVVTGRDAGETHRLMAWSTGEWVHGLGDYVVDTRTAAQVLKDRDLAWAWTGCCPGPRGRSELCSAQSPVSIRAGDHQRRPSQMLPGGQVRPIWEDFSHSIGHTLSLCSSPRFLCTPAPPQFPPTRTKPSYASLSF